MKSVGDDLCCKYHRVSWNICRWNIFRNGSVDETFPARRGTFAASKCSAVEKYSDIYRKTQDFPGDLQKYEFVQLRGESSGIKGRQSIHICFAKAPIFT